MKSYPICSRLTFLIWRALPKQKSKFLGWFLTWFYLIFIWFFRWNAGVEEKWYCLGYVACFYFITFSLFAMRLRDFAYPLLLRFVFFCFWIEFLSLSLMLFVLQQLWYCNREIKTVENKRLSFFVLEILWSTSAFFYYIKNIDHLFMN